MRTHSCTEEDYQLLSRVSSNLSSGISGSLRDTLPHWKPDKLCKALQFEEAREDKCQDHTIGISHLEVALLQQCTDVKIGPTGNLRFSWSFIPPGQLFYHWKMWCQLKFDCQGQCNLSHWLRIPVLITIINCLLILTLSWIWLSHENKVLHTVEATLTY